MKKCRLVFVLYFLVVAVLPYSHGHACDEHSLSFSDMPVYSSAYMDLFADRHSSHDDHHLHFVAEDANSGLRLSASCHADSSGDISVSTMTEIELSRHLVVLFQDCTKFYFGNFCSPYSGLSPPSSYVL